LAEYSPQTSSLLVGSGFGKGQSDGESSEKREGIITERAGKLIEMQGGKTGCRVQKQCDHVMS